MHSGFEFRIFNHQWRNKRAGWELQEFFLVGTLKNLNAKFIRLHMGIFVGTLAHLF
jgi:hypothetical protein